MQAYRIKTESTYIVLYPATQYIEVNGKRSHLPISEFLILKVLIENQGRLVSCDTLHQILRNGDFHIEPHSNILQVHICYLRKIVGNRVILSIRSRGYMLGTPMIEYQYRAQGVDIFLMADRKTLKNHSMAWSLGCRQYDLLKRLLDARGRAVSAEDLYEHIGLCKNPLNTIQSHLSQIRKMGIGFKILKKTGEGYYIPDVQLVVNKNVVPTV